MTVPQPPAAALGILLSAQAAARLQQRIATALAGRPYQLVVAEQAVPGAALDLALLTRDVTGASTKYQVLPATQHFHDLMRQAPTGRSSSSCCSAAWP
jgi:hypothetical protein